MWARTCFLPHEANLLADFVELPALHRIGLGALEALHGERGQDRRHEGGQGADDADQRSAGPALAERHLHLLDDLEGRFLGVLFDAGAFVLGAEKGVDRVVDAQLRGQIQIADPQRGQLLQRDRGVLELDEAVLDLPDERAELVDRAPQPDHGGGVLSQQFDLGVELHLLAVQLGLESGDALDRGLRLGRKVDHAELLLELGQRVLRFRPVLPDLGQALVQKDLPAAYTLDRERMHLFAEPLHGELQAGGGLIGVVVVVGDHQQVGFEQVFRIEVLTKPFPRPHDVVVAGRVGDEPLLSRECVQDFPADEQLLRAAGVRAGSRSQQACEVGQAPGVRNPAEQGGCPRAVVRTIIGDAHRHAGGEPGGQQVPPRLGVDHHGQDVVGQQDHGRDAGGGDDEAPAADQDQDQVEHREGVVLNGLRGRFGRRGPLQLTHRYPL